MTRRNSKLLVELTIGVIGLLGILFAQMPARATPSELTGQVLEQTSELGVQSVTPKIDWFEVLFSIYK